jgi:hypothetical protein
MMKMVTDEEISQAQKLLAQRRWEKATLKDRLIQGQRLKMSRITKRGHLLCARCDQAMTRNQNGDYVHVSKSIKDHEAIP